MAYFPAHCDNQCKDCEMNKCGWCIWKNKATNYYSIQSISAKDFNQVDSQYKFNQL